MELFSPYLAYNAIGWVIGGASLLLFGFQIWRIDHNLSTQLTRHYILYSLSLGGGIVIFSLPGLLTADPGILKGSYIAGEGLIDFSLVYQAWIAAHFIVGSGLAKRIATIATGFISAYLWVMQSISPTPYRENNSVVWATNSGAHIAITAIMTILLLPVMLFFFKQSIATKDVAARIKSFSTGMICAIIYVQYMILLYHYHDHQPFWASIINIVSFSAFLLALLIPRKLTETVMTTQMKPSSPQASVEV
jgi:fumarate reductase subunit D